MATHIPVNSRRAIPMVPGPTPILRAWRPTSSHASPLKKSTPSQIETAFLAAGTGDPTLGMLNSDLFAVEAAVEPQSA